MGDPLLFGADTDLHLGLTDPDPTPFFSDFKECKEYFFL